MNFGSLVVKASRAVLKYKVETGFCAPTAVVFLQRSTIASRMHSTPPTALLYLFAEHAMERP